MQNALKTGLDVTTGDELPARNPRAVVDTSPLFQSVRVGALELSNRLVMAPMTRSQSPGGVPGADVAEYYRRRAAGGLGLIVTEGVYVPQAGSGFSDRVPHLYGEAALAGWRRVVEAVHAEGSKIMPQLWHVGLIELQGDPIVPERVVSPSALTVSGAMIGEPASTTVIEETIAAFGEAAANALAIGCDGIQLHGAHGYLIDQFFWETTNRREDGYGGATLFERSRFAIEVIKECRARTTPDFTIALRFSQWKQQNFAARLVETPAELEAFLLPLVDAGVDLFDASTRRFWEPEFAGSDMNLAGWTRKVTGKPTATVGSVTLNTDLFSSFVTESRTTDNLDKLMAMLNRGDFDLVDVGRAVIADPDWAQKIRDGQVKDLAPYHLKLLEVLD